MFYPFNYQIVSLQSLTVPLDQESESKASSVNCSNSLVVEHPQLASDTISSYPIEQSSIQQNVESGLSADYLVRSRLQHHQIDPFFIQTFNQWYPNYDSVFPPTNATYSTTAPFDQSDLSASFYRSSESISEPIEHNYVMENSAYNFHSKHFKPNDGAVCTEKYSSEAAYPNNFLFPPAPTTNQPANVQCDIQQIGDQQQINKQFTDVSGYQMTSTPTEMSSTLNPSGNRFHWRPKVHRCTVCGTGYTSKSHLNRHVKTAMHLKELKKGFRSRCVSE